MIIRQNLTVSDVTGLLEGGRARASSTVEMERQMMAGNHQHGLIISPDRD